MKISIIGAGRVGKCLAFLLKDKFKIAGLTSKSMDEKLKNYFNIFDSSQNKNIASKSDIIFITTPDDLIKEVANEIFSDDSIKNKFVFHCSGCHPSTILEKAKKNNCFIGSIHPLQSVPDITQGIKNLKNAYFCIEGDKEAIEIAKKIVDSINGKYFVIDTKFKSLYHIGAVFSSNFINALIYTTCEIYKKIGISNDYGKIVELISPLFTGTINGILNLGILKSLTGPIIRGDFLTIENHLKSLEKYYPELIDIYKNLSNQTVKLAKKYDIDDLTLEKIKNIEKLVR